MKSCSCHSKKPFAQCCEPFLLGEKIVQSPLELMQSRFSAYVSQDEGYLLRTWDPSTRPQAIDMSQTPKWLGLRIIKTSARGNRGVVEFEATYLHGNAIGTMHETSSFTKKQGLWFYVDGVLHKPQPSRTGRNNPCPCGSGRKFKKCCM
ncbi:MAG: YchJ family metal-binding protein [Desulfobulbaceae bacterium]|jgi:SEC-C motif-containing protein|nr:YchJ family metal-binding protein [Desulfobulbaceae bacterium]